MGCKFGPVTFLFVQCNRITAWSSFTTTWRAKKVESLHPSAGSCHWDLRPSSGNHVEMPFSWHMIIYDHIYGYGSTSITRTVGWMIDTKNRLKSVVPHVFNFDPYPCEQNAFSLAQFHRNLIVWPDTLNILCIIYYIYMFNVTFKNRWPCTYDAYEACINHERQLLMHSMSTDQQVRMCI